MFQIIIYTNKLFDKFDKDILEGTRIDTKIKTVKWIIETGVFKKKKLMELRNISKL